MRTHKHSLAGQQEVLEPATNAQVLCSSAYCVCVCVCVPVLAVLPVVVVSTVTDVSMGGAGLPMALSLVLTWIQMASVCAAFPIVA